MQSSSTPFQRQPSAALDSAQHYGPYSGASNAHHGQSGARWHGSGYNTFSYQTTDSDRSLYASDQLTDRPPASKRARIERADNDIPSRSSGSWTPLDQPSSGQHRGRGLALPPVASNARAPNDASKQSGQRVGEQVAGSHMRNNASTELEEQVRTLEQFNNSTGDGTNAQQLNQYATNPVDTGEDQGTVPATLPERGAPQGKMLRLACVACMAKKRKCSKDFPCNECQKFGEMCVPSVRKRPLGATKQAPPSEQRGDESHETTGRDYYTKKDGTVVRTRNDQARYGISLPPVVDDYQEWANMRLKYNPVPEDLDEVREKLFKVEQPILLNSQQYADYWPHMSNVWARGKGPKFNENGTQVETWDCRNLRRLSRNQRHLRLHEHENQGLRRKTPKMNVFEGTEECKGRIRIVSYIRHAVSDDDHPKGLGSCNCAPDWIFLERTQTSLDLPHRHTLESQDEYKRTDALMFLAEHKVAEGGRLSWELSESNALLTIYIV